MMSRSRLDPAANPRRRFGTARVFALVLAIAATIAGAEFYALYQSRQARLAPPPVPSSAAASVAPTAQEDAPIGAIDSPAGEAVVGPRVTISGWALASAGIREVAVRAEGLALKAAIGVARPDVAQLKPGYPDAASAGFEFTGDLSSHPAPPGTDRRVLTVVAVAKDGRETVLGTRSVIAPDALARWRGLALPGTPFHLLPALSGVSLGGAGGLDTEYTPYVSATTPIGMRVPILYMRTTKGPAFDYAFDAAWDIERRCGERRIAEDSLDVTLAHARTHALPVLITLNGGIWADASCDVPAWDINDKLEAEPRNCQWNEKNEVMPDDALKHLPGSQDAPELGRSLTFNVYARDVRRYKKRNLQQAAAPLVAFMRERPALFVGVSLDPDTYLNPFFGEQQWYDYNPGTLRQFRHWLAGTGPYAGPSEPGVPDLSSYRRRKPLSLDVVSRLAGRAFRTWDEVDPPRRFSRDAAHPFWRDPWVREWEVFRRHLVHLHYDELAQWLVEAGMPRDRIWSSQGFMAPATGAMPFALTIESPVKNFDSGGMSVEGAKPRGGHLGAILYGGAAVDDVVMENGKRLFATLASIDPAFAVVEFNTADLRNPEALPTYAAGYRAFRDLWNAGARYVSPMAWNGSNGVNAGKPGFVTFTAWRNTPLEDAARDFMVGRAGLPLGALLWTFGSPQHADGDGWVAETGAIALARGALMLSTDPQGRVALTSPRGLALAPERIGRIVAGLPRDAAIAAIAVYARAAGATNWVQIAHARDDALVAAAAGRIVTRHRAAHAAPADQLKVEIRFAAPATAVPLTRIAVLPSGG
ncbi:MAG: hypothetical protein ABI812_05015 [Betaproteobacteria bacterium]